MRKKVQLKWCVMVVALLVATAPDGHEITTHALITARAYQQSTLNPQTADSVVPLIGLDRLDHDQPFAFVGLADSTWYYDDAAVANPIDNPPPDPSPLSVLREPQNQERRVFNALVAAGYISGEDGAAIEQQVRSWLMRGAVREDDNDYFLLWWHEKGDRDSDPYGYLFRAFGHFYDPYLGRPADNEAYCAEYTCVESIEWALGRTDPLTPSSNPDNTNRRNHFTWQDARNNYWWALTLKRDVLGDGWDVADAMISSNERMDRWATTINNLGHVIHLLQDTSQPQHVRNDMHGPPNVAWVSGDGAADSAFEAFTDYRVLRDYDDASGLGGTGGNPLRHMVGEDLPTINNLPRIRLGDSNPYPGGGGQVQFSTPVKFFTTRHVETGCGDASVLSRRGLADFSNRSFFTAGTLPGFRDPEAQLGVDCVNTDGPTYPLPPNELNTAGYTEVDITSGLRVNGRVVLLSELAYPITDDVAPGYDQSIGTLAAYGGKAPLVTEGIWYDVIPDDLGPEFLQRVGYTLTYNNLRYMADVMLPRAVGYSAGMIDYFFRGRLDLASPRGGLFGVVDQGTPHTVDGYGYPRNLDNSVFGFETLRVRVKNATADIVESGTTTTYTQDAHDGELVAIARYHRNPCYQPDLSGEYVKKPDGSLTVPAGCSVEQTRTDYQEISVSAPLPIDANGNFPGTSNGSDACANLGNLDTGPSGTCANDDGVLAEFDFSADPIPINATDLFLQVAYRGQLGEEVDGIALGRMDIMEPQYYSLFNNTDWFLYQNEWRIPEEVDDQVPGDTAPIPIQAVIWCWEDQLVFGFPTADPIGPGQFLRVAVLSDKEPHSTGHVVDFDNVTWYWHFFPLAGIERQSNQEVGGVYDPEPWAYGRGTTLGSLMWNSYYRYYPTANPPQTPDGVSLTLSLTPTLGGRGPGLPVTGIALYDGVPHSLCAQANLANLHKQGRQGAAVEHGLP